MDGSLPQDHEDQLQLGIRIVQTAFANKMQSLEQEIRSLRLTNEEQRANVAALQKKNSALEVELVESHQRSQQLAEENKELFKTVGSLRKQIGRLEHLKAAVMSSIQDDAEKEAEIGETRAFMSDDYLRSSTPITSAQMGYGPPPSRQQPLMGASYGASAAAMTPASGSMGAGMNGMGASAPASASPPVDGKAFFRQARQKLQHEAFNQFLASIKRLNNQEQTREETLGEARRLFGTENQDLYHDFESLLDRQGM